MLNIFNFLAALTVLNGSVVDGASYSHDAGVRCKANAFVAVNSVISSREDAILLFDLLARKLNNGKFAGRKYSYDVKYVKGFWTVYGEDVAIKSDGEPLGFGGLYLSVEACSGRVVEFRYTR
ncbi:hypothetical protein [Caulobacter sp. UNC279MFTsu5.1]|uniref:hypothetical protein n=1 Tax=Caulobacter sp. UNC279MFTsu5.1 TaxID=1502775 RepID=UPI0003731155|nr:hypothetical protein [Caulobacter sp. UNC279MFTsu5.1]